jgi:hypothetical protein
MRELRALIWKEWHETRLFLWIAWGLFIGLPAVGLLEALATGVPRHPEFSASPSVVVGAPILAIVVGVGGTCRDLRDTLANFWQGQPLGSHRFLGVKYVVGILVTAMACALPIIVDLACGVRSGFVAIALALVPHWLLLFSVAFACGCIFRRAAQASAGAIVAALLLYAVPMVFPSLWCFNVMQAVVPSSGSPSGLVLPAFAFGYSSTLSMVCVGVAALSAAGAGLVAVRFGWRIRSGISTVLLAALVAFLALLASGEHQLGTNLSVLDSAGLAAGQRVAAISQDGSGVSLLLCRPDLPSGHLAVAKQRLTIREGRIAMEEPKTTSYEEMLWGDAAVMQGFQTTSAFCVKDGHEVGYQAVMDEKIPGGPHPQRCRLYSSWDNVGPSPVADLGAPRTEKPFHLWLWGNKLAVVGDATFVFDITDWRDPTLITTVDQPWISLPTATETGIEIALPNVPGMPPEERLKFAIAATDSAQTVAFDGQYWCTAALGVADGVLPSFQARIDVCRLKSIDERRARFQPYSQFVPSFFQQFVAQGFPRLAIADGKLYACFDRMLYTFDLASRGELRPLAHFAAPGLRCATVLENGQILATGDQLWLLGPPPGHS